ncbi:hypothetical protein KM043_017818 [Ampulex compressa]|nr:hypothetical protein KM043_017818 [Ampulex compressa]
MREAGRARIHTQAHETPCKGVRHEEGVGKAGTGMRPLSIGVRVWRIRAGVGGSDPDGPLDLWNLDLRARERTQHRVRTNTNLRAYTRARRIYLCPLTVRSDQRDVPKRCPAVSRPGLSGGFKLER